MGVVGVPFCVRQPMELETVSTARANTWHGQSHGSWQHAVCNWLRSDELFVMVNDVLSQFWSVTRAFAFRCGRIESMTALKSVLIVGGESQA